MTLLEPTIDLTGTVTKSGIEKANGYLTKILTALSANFTNGTLPQWGIYPQLQIAAEYRQDKFTSDGQVLHISVHEPSEALRQRLGQYGITTYKDSSGFAIPVKSLALCGAHDFERMFRAAAEDYRTRETQRVEDQLREYVRR